MSDGEDAEGELRKEALSAQAEFYRLKSAELALGIARKERRSRLARGAAATAVDAAEGAGRLAFTAGKVLLGLLALGIAYAVYANATEAPKPSTVDLEASDRRKVLDDCANGRAAAQNWRVTRTYDGRLGYVSGVALTGDVLTASRSCSEVNEGSWPAAR